MILGSDFLKAEKELRIPTLLEHQLLLQPQATRVATDPFASVAEITGWRPVAPFPQIHPDPKAWAQLRCGDLVL